MSWYQLTEDESDRLNPPTKQVIVEHDRTLVVMLDDQAWLPVGYIPTPRTRAGWLVYHLIHGLVMRYPIHKVIGYSLASLFADQSELWGFEA